VGDQLHVLSSTLLPLSLPVGQLPQGSPGDERVGASLPGHAAPGDYSLSPAFGIGRDVGLTAGRPPGSPSRGCPVDRSTKSNTVQRPAPRRPGVPPSTGGPTGRRGPRWGGGGRRTSTRGVAGQLVGIGSASSSGGEHPGSPGSSGCRRQPHPGVVDHSFRPTGIRTFELQIPGTASYPLGHGPNLYLKEDNRLPTPRLNPPPTSGLPRHLALTFRWTPQSPPRHRHHVLWPRATTVSSQRIGLSPCIYEYPKKRSATSPGRHRLSVSPVDVYTTLTHVTRGPHVPEVGWTYPQRRPKYCIDPFFLVVFLSSSP
jgi:hypothetical protein